MSRQTAKVAPAWTAETISRNVTKVVLPRVKAGFHQRFLLAADVHWDNPHCKRDIFKRHLDEALETGAGIIFPGDFFCAMQGKYDKRSSKSDLRPEHAHGDYLDSLVQTAADYLRPYARNIVLVGDGNHETSIKKRHETDLIERLCSLLSTGGVHVQHGGYTGWVRFMFNRGQVRQSLRLWYMHGYGGGGPVTQDMIQNQRMRSYVEGADIIVTGHTHDCFVNENTKVVLTDANAIRHAPVWNVKCPTYKEEYGAGESGWHIETGKPPKPIGGWWMDFQWNHREDRPTVSFTKAS